jgi:PRA1 family protein
VVFFRAMSVFSTNVAVQEWFRQQKESIQPWSDFLNTKKFALPKSFAPVGVRLVKNVERFQGNYLFVFLGLVAVCM